MALRQGMSAYRFDVPIDGTYRVDLHFAEIVATKAGTRTFNVLIEGEPVLTGLDVFAEAGANAALDRSFDVQGQRRHARYRVRRPARRPTDRERHPGHAPARPGS